MPWWGWFLLGGVTSIVLVWAVLEGLYWMSTWPAAYTGNDER